MLFPTNRDSRSRAPRSEASYSLGGSQKAAKIAKIAKVAQHSSRLIAPQSTREIRGFLGFRNG
jgi:hypothetical protein